MSRHNQGRQNAAPQHSAELVNTQLADQLKDAVDATIERIADGVASESEIELAKAGNEVPDDNPFVALWGTPEHFHFRPQDSSAGKELKNGTVRKYLAKTDAIGGMMSAELTIVASERITRTNEGAFQEREIQVWFPRGVTALDAAMGEFENYKQRILNQYNTWCESMTRPDVIATAITGARLIRRTPIQESAAK
jgi:hypothetical protein